MDHWLNEELCSKKCSLFCNIAQKKQAEIYSKLLIKSDVKSNELIKIINFNYTYQYLFKHENNEDCLTIEYLFSTDKSFSQVNEKKISFYQWVIFMEAFIINT